MSTNEPLLLNSDPAGDGIAESELLAERRRKLSALRKAQPIAFPNDFERRDLAADLHRVYANVSSETLDAEPIEVVIAGRLMLKRVMGKAAFATLQDMSGRVQLYLSIEALAAEALEAFKHWDLGDIIGATGCLFKTRTDELTVRVSRLRLLTKSLRPLPEKFHGLTDTEQKYRQRYLDLITQEETRKTFITRSRILQCIREYMIAKGYLEVETPMMHPIPGGANARPFITHHHALDRQLYLRIAPELYLKRLVVGGLERVFEINRNFRNEGMSTRHNPEFTMMEFYEAYRDYRYYMAFTEDLLRTVTEQILGSTRFIYQQRELDFALPFQRLTITEAILKYQPEYAPVQLENISFLRQEIKRLTGQSLPEDGLGALQLRLFEETTEAKLWEPTFIYAYPAEVSPLARRSDQFPGLTDRFELFVAGRELANGFSELNDPEDQEERFLAQMRAKEAGDAEAMHYDADYIKALEYGLPPTAGEGIGMDRLVMLLTDAPAIRDVILFPQMRAE